MPAFSASFLALVFSPWPKKEKRRDKRMGEKQPEER
jgi:hypothetical protein